MQPVFPPMADADDHLSEIARAIATVNPQVLTLKHSAFLAELFMEEADLESTNVGPHDHSVTSMWASDGLTGKGSPNNMPVLNMISTTCNRYYGSKLSAFINRPT